MRNAKIVCTVGPASDSLEMLDALADAGMSVARTNASHGSPEHRRTVIDRICEVDEMSEVHVHPGVGAIRKYSPIITMRDRPFSRRIQGRRHGGKQQ